MEKDDSLGLELDAESDFFEAAEYVQFFVADGGFSTEVLLRLYALYKQSTEGPCSASRPFPWQRQALAKWRVWHELLDMPKHEAMVGYVALLSEVKPEWKKWKSGEGSSAMGGQVFSRHVAAVDATNSQDDAKETSDLFKLCINGDVEGASKLIDGGNYDECETDSERRTALHWSADGGHTEIVGKLLRAGWEPNAQDVDGQTPLHYASLCEHEEVAKALIGGGAKCDLSDGSGETAADLAPSSWHFLTEKIKEN